MGCRYGIDVISSSRGVKEVQEERTEVVPLCSVSKIPSVGCIGGYRALDYCLQVALFIVTVNEYFLIRTIRLFVDGDSGDCIFL